MRVILSLACSLIFLFACQEKVEFTRADFDLPKDVDIVECDVGSYGGFFVISINGEPKTFNPLFMTDANSSTVTGWTLGKLIDYDPIKQEHIPALAKSWEMSEDCKTYIFHLREGVKFSDGVEFSAEDVIFTLDCIFSPKLDSDGNPVLDERGKEILKYPSRNAGQYTIGGEYIKYKLIDKYTIELSTAVVYAPFINDIAYLDILPKHKLLSAFEDGTLSQAWSTKTALENPEEIVSLGAFKLSSYKVGERLVLEPNPHYWKVDKSMQRLPYIDYLIFKFVADGNTGTVLFATGQSDCANIGASDYPWVKKFANTYDFEIFDRGADSGIQYITFNQNPRSNSEGKPFVEKHKLAWFQSKEFRQAVLHAINRKDLIEGTFFGRAQETHSIISSSNTRWHNKDVKQYPYSQEKSKELLKQAGFVYKNGTLFDKENNPVEFSLIIAESSQSAVNTATTIVENLKDIGIKVKLTALDFSALLSKINDSYDFEAVMLGFTGGGDPSGGKAIYKSDGFLHIWNPRQEEAHTDWERQVDELMTLQESEMDFEKRRAIVYEMQDVFSEQLPLLFLTTPFSYSGVKKKWKNIKIPKDSSIIWNLEELYQDND